MKQPCSGAEGGRSDAGGARGGVGPVGGMTPAPAGTSPRHMHVQGQLSSSSQLAVALALAPSSSDLTTAKSVLSNAKRNLLAGPLELDSTDDLVANFERALGAARRITGGPAPVSCAGAGTHKSRSARNYALQIFALLRLSLEDLDHTLNDTVLR
jgi:hypothetical protein